MHVGSADTLRCAVEVEVDSPESGAERVGKSGLALTVEGVCFAQDVWDIFRQAFFVKDAR